MVNKLERTGRDKFEKKKNDTFGSKKNIDEDKEFGGELDDLWSAPGQTSGYEISKRMKQFKDGFGKKDTIKVKTVIAPAGGQSYNPNAADHKKLLKKVAEKEEEIAQKRLESLKALRPSLFENDNDDDDSDKSDSEPSADASSDGEDSDAPINPKTVPVNRDDIKTDAQRNRMKMLK